MGSGCPPASQQRLRQLEEEQHQGRYGQERPETNRDEDGLGSAGQTDNGDPPLTGFAPKKKGVGYSADALFTSTPAGPLSAKPISGFDLEYVRGPVPEQRRAIAAEIEVTVIIRPFPLLSPHEEQRRPRAVLPPENACPAQ